MTDPNPSFSRRAMLAAALVGGSAAAATLSGAPAAQAAPANDKKQFRLTVLGTTDLHNNVFNWDYFKDEPYSDNAGNKIGIAQAATLINAVRAERGAANTLTIDAGDTIQGTPLAYYFAKINPISGSSQAPDGAGHERRSAMTRSRSATTNSTTASRCCALGRSSWIFRCSAPTCTTP